MKLSSHARKFPSARLTSRYWEAIVRTGTEQKSVQKILKKRNRVNFHSTNKLNRYLVICSFVTSLLIFFFFSSTYLWFLFYLILDKNCGSKNWGGPIYRKFNRTIDRPQDGAALSQIPIYKNIHISNLLIRVCICFLFIVSVIISCLRCPALNRSSFIISCSFLACVSFRQMMLCMVYVYAVYLYFSFFFFSSKNLYISPG